MNGARAAGEQELDHVTRAIAYRLAQLAIMQETGGAHHARHLGLRIAALHFELDLLEVRRSELERIGVDQ